MQSSFSVVVARDKLPSPCRLQCQVREILAAGGSFQLGIDDLAGRVHDHLHIDSDFPGDGLARFLRDGRDILMRDFRLRRAQHGDGDGWFW